MCALQVIAQPDERYEKYCRESDFIREHIFPGGTALPAADAACACDTAECMLS
jgi:cyclopropane fatty-acyl-phospholipid synthase-like methyltransferase